MDQSSTFARLVKWTAHYGAPHGFCHRRAGYPGLGGDRPLLRFSDTWQLVINTGATIITFGRV